MNTPQPIRYHSKSQFQHGLLVKQTAKKIYIILMQPGIHLDKLPISEAQYLTELNTPVGRAKKQIRSAARQWHDKISKECRSYLQ